MLRKPWRKLCKERPPQITNRHAGIQTVCNRMADIIFDDPAFSLRTLSVAWEQKKKHYIIPNEQYVHFKKEARSRLSTSYSFRQFLTRTGAAKAPWKESWKFSKRCEVKFSPGLVRPAKQKSGNYVKVKSSWVNLKRCIDKKVSKNFQKNPEDW